MPYTLTRDPSTVVRNEDGAFIPFDPDNLDYQAYLAWLDEGNEPTPYTPPATTLPETASTEERIDALEQRVGALEGDNG